MENQNIKAKTYIPKIYYKDKLLKYKETPLTVKEADLCPYCKEEITFEQIIYIEPRVDKVLAKKIIEHLNKYRLDYKLDTCLRKAHFIAQCLVESGKFKKLKESMAYNPKSLKEYFSKDEFIELTDINLELYNDKIKLIDTRKDESKKEDKNKKDKYAQLDKINPAYIYGNTIKKKYQETIYLNEEKTIAIKILSHMHDEKIVANKKYANRADIGNNGGNDGYNFLGRGIIQLTGRDAYTAFSSYRKDNQFKEDNSGYLDFKKVENAKKIEDTDNPIYAVQSAVWFWDIYKNYAKIENECDSDNIKKVTKITNGGTNHLKERNEYIKKAREVKGFKVFEHYEEIYKNGLKEDKENVILNLRNISQDNLAYDSHHKKKINLKDEKAIDLLKKLQEVKTLSEIKPKRINLRLNSDLKIIPIK